MTLRDLGIRDPNFQISIRQVGGWARATRKDSVRESVDRKRSLNLPLCSGLYFLTRATGCIVDRFTRWLCMCDRWAFFFFFFKYTLYQIIWAPILVYQPALGECSCGCHRRSFLSPAVVFISTRELTEFCKNRC